MICRSNIFFDLDGTLLPLDINEFIDNYFKLLTREFADVFDPVKFIESLMAATDKMINNNGEKLNSQVFIDCFFDLVQVEDRESIMCRFDDFYREVFPELKGDIEAGDIPFRLINYLRDKGFRLVLATNPVFPLEAIKERLRWTGIRPDHFSS
ncbi:MAG: HAD family hydrolase [Halanaerobiaceae bacterium]